MPLLDATLNSMADHLASLAPFLSLHTADPGTTGANATTHARVAAAWPAATSGGDLAISNKSFTGGASSGPVLYVGLWSAASGGTFRGGFQIPNNGTNDLTSNAAGAYTLTAMAISGTAT